MTESDNVLAKTTPFHRPTPAEGKYRFFCTGTPELLFQGFDVTLDLNYTPEECKNYLLSEINHRIKIQKGDLIVYLSCGIPFITGTLRDIYDKENGSKVKRYIYGVLTSPLSNVDLDNNYNELCNINDEARKILLSPFTESSFTSLCNISCLLGYQNHDGNNRELLERALAYCVHFPPLTTCMRRVIDRYNVTGRDIITITSTLFTFFRYLNPTRLKSEEVFESVFKCCNIVTSVDKIPDKIPVTKVELSPNMIDDLKFLDRLKQGRYAYIWREDVDQDFEFASIEKVTPEKFDELSQSNSFFTPISPLSVLRATGCSIVRGKEHCFLYVRQSSEKERKSQNEIEIIDPINGFIESKDVYEFSKEQDDPINGNTMGVIDPSEVKQVIMIAIDESLTMNQKFSNKPITETDNDTKSNTNKDINYELAAIQYLTIFANRLCGYRIPCIVGVMSFNKESTIRTNLTPFVPDIEKGLTDFKLSGKCDFFNALTTSVDELLLRTRNESGDRIYDNAVCRILMLTSSTNIEINPQIVELTQKMVSMEIVLDCVVFGPKDEFKGLTTISHISGGLTFNPSTMKEGLELFEKSAFLDYNERDLSHHNRPIIPGDRRTAPSRIKPEMVTEEFINDGIKEAEINDEVRNVYIFRAANTNRLATPDHVIYMNRNDQIPSRRFRRILRELYYVSKVMDKDSPEHDPDLIVLTYKSNLDNWIVFLKGTEGTFYEGKWYELYISFPDNYPTSPPVIRFMSIPYHLNISSEGRICLDIVEKGYKPACRVLNIIQQVKEIFIIPSTDTPIQIEILETFINDPDEYHRKAKVSADEVGKENYEDFYPKRTYIQGLSDDEDEENIGLDYDRNRTPLFMISQIYGDSIRDPVFESSGIFYERAELRRIVSSFTYLSSSDESE